MVKWYINRKRPFRLLLLRGAHSWELQIGHHVFQVRHKNWHTSGFHGVKKFNYFYTEFV